VDSVIMTDTYKYDDFFKSQIMKKKMDHSYRIFKKVNRSAESFPAAQEFSWGQRPINVWCSNDYLGMSAHPNVKAAVRNAVDKYGAGAGGTRNISGNRYVSICSKRSGNNLFCAHATSRDALAQSAHATICYVITQPLATL
jgi:hypothetical protein